MEDMNEGQWCLFRCTEFYKAVNLLATEKKNVFVDYTNKRTHLQRNKALCGGAGLLAKFPHN